MNWQDVIAWGVVAAAAVYAGRSLWRTLGGKTGCGGGCGCSEEKKPATPTRRLKQIPMVGIDQVGRPPSTDRHSG